MSTHARCVQLHTHTHTADPPGLTLSLFSQLSSCFPPPLMSLSQYIQLMSGWSFCSSRTETTHSSLQQSHRCLSFNYPARDSAHTVIRWWAVPRSLALSPVCEWELLWVCVITNGLLSLWGPDGVRFWKISEVSTFFLILILMGWVQDCFCFWEEWIQHQHCFKCALMSQSVRCYEDTWTF